MKKLYKFYQAGLTNDHGNIKWKIGEWYKEDTAKLCSSGFHASKTPIQALGYVKGEILAEVSVRGKSDISDDKECWTEMKINKAWHWKKEDSVELAIFAAEQVIDIYEKKYSNDDRPRNAIEAAKKYLAAVQVGDNDAAAHAAHAVAHAAHAADAAAYAAYAAAYAAYAAAHAAHAADAAAYAADAAAYAADAAAHAADAAAHAADAAAYAAYAAAHAAHAADKKLVQKIDKWFIKKLKTLELYE